MAWYLLVTTSIPSSTFLFTIGGVCCWSGSRLGRVVVFVAGLVRLPVNFAGLPQPITAVVFVAGLESQLALLVLFVADLVPQPVPVVLFVAVLEPQTGPRETLPPW